MPATDNAAKSIGRAIERERRAHGLTQEQVARHLNVTKAAVSKWELGLSAPDVAQLPRIALREGIDALDAAYRELDARLDA